MLWPFGKTKEASSKQEGASIFDHVRINDRIGVEYGGKTYVTRVEDIRSDEIDIAAPADSGSGGLRAGCVLTINVFQHKGLHRFTAEIKCVTKANVPVLTLRRFVDQGTVEQRNYERVKDQIPIHFRSEIGMASTAPWNVAVTRDLSGGGAHVFTDEADGLTAGAFVEVELLVPGEKPIKALAKVVRASRAQGRGSQYSLGFRFAQIRDADRAVIVKYVRNRISVLRADRRSVVRCGQQVPMTFRVTSRPGAGQQWFNGAILDVSTGGLRVFVGETDNVKVGETLEIKLALANNGSLVAGCEVVWVRPTDDGRPGRQAGARYNNIAPDVQANIAAFIAKAHAQAGATKRDAA